MWTAGVRYRVHSTLPLFRVLSQSNTVHTFAWSIFIAFSHLCLCLPVGSFFHVSLQKRCMCFSPPMHMPQAVPILSSLIESLTLGEERQLVKFLIIHFSFVSCCFVQSVHWNGSRYPRNLEHPKLWSFHCSLLRLQDTKTSLRLYCCVFLPFQGGCERDGWTSDIKAQDKTWSGPLRESEVKTRSSQHLEDDEVQFEYVLQESKLVQQEPNVSATTFSFWRYLKYTRGSQQVSGLMT